MQSTKIVITNRGALQAKYGMQLRRVDRALARLVKADAQRGIATRIVAIDQAADMEPFGCPPMGEFRDRRAGRIEFDWEGAKRCVDAIDAKLRPHYFVLLGAQDVVPMQPLENTAGFLGDRGEMGDEDPNVPSDLPYACETVASADPADFQGPTRVVGRLPDVPGATDPAYLVAVIGKAAAARPLPRDAYARWMALSAQTWQVSTRKTLAMVFGSSEGLVLSPPKTDDWTPEDLAPRLHYINCHGGNCDDVFIGEDDREFETALSAHSLRRKVTPGTVVVAECCYGAKVFDPDKEAGAERQGRLGIPLVYLREGAYGFFGSTTIAYGQAQTTEYADVLCRQFARHVLAGRSLGRAALEARLDLMRNDRWRDPVKLKTLAQFNLLGDPSIHPVASGEPEKRRRRDPDAVREALVAQRHRARVTARRRGRQLHDARVTFERLGREQLPAEVESEIRLEAEKLGMIPKLLALYRMSAKVEIAASGRGSRRDVAQADRVVVMIDVMRREMGFSRRGDNAKRRAVPCYGGVVAYLDENGNIVEKKLITSR